MRRYLRGEIYYANLDPVFGSEQSGFRPVLIIQNDIGNRYSPTVIVAPITSKPDVKAKLPTHCRLDLKNCLNEPSVVLLEQLRTLDKRRLKKYIGKLKKSSMNEVTSRVPEPSLRRQQRRSGSFWRNTSISTASTLGRCPLMKAAVP